MTNINQLSDLELYRLKALEQYHFDDLMPEESKRSVINFSLEDLKSFFMMDLEEFKLELINQEPDHPVSWIKDQLKEIQNLLD
jgi:hypothetical protein